MYIVLQFTFFKIATYIDKCHGKEKTIVNSLHERRTPYSNISKLSISWVGSPL